MTRLKKLGKERHRKTFIRHGAPEDPEKNYGVPIGDLKPIQKKIKKDYALAKELFATGNSDAQYLAGLIADETRMTKADLNRWAREAAWNMIANSAVGGVAADSPHGVALATKWIDAKQEQIAMTGWTTLSGCAAVRPDDDLDLELIARLLNRVVGEIHGERNRVKDAMNMFVISVGCYVAPLKDKALAAAKKIGKVEVDVGDTACKTHLAADYIRKVETMGRVGKKRKSARC
jgi:3-methyladenine DNA glycosylase AlkD